MNKTISVNIAGFVFNIEELAYEQLKEYLDKIRLNFGNEEERDEIMADIELRIAELFHERISTNKEVIIEKDITEIVEILGVPEDFASDDDAQYAKENEEKESETITQTSIRKRFFRDKDDAIIGGVCSGLGHYFDVTPIVFRIIFAFLFIMAGSGILLYIILFIVVPEARTTADKIEMKGRTVNVESIKEHFSNVRETITDEDNQSRIKNNVKNVVDKGVKASYSVFQVISKVIGILLTIGGTVFFVLFMLVVFGDTGILPFLGEGRIESFPTLIEILYPGDEPSSLIFISFLIVAIIPIASLIITGVRILFNYRQNIKKLVLTLVVIWTVAASTLFIYSVELASDFKNDKQIAYSVQLEDKVSDIMFVDVMDDDQFSNHITPYDDWGSTDLVKVDDAFIYFAFPQIGVQTTLDTGEFRINVYKSSHGSTTEEAISKIEAIEYPIKTVGNKLLLPAYLKLPRKDKLRAQYLRMEITVPKGKMIKFGDNIDRLLRFINYEEFPWEASYNGTQWVSNGLSFAEKSNTDLTITETEVDEND